MTNLKIKGVTQVDDMKFHHIEGGFGKDKRSILVKEIANIHNKEVRKINQAINMNKKRFNDNVDVIDLKGTKFEVNLIDNGIYTQNAVNRSSNIYILSERGYSKLLKILEDDFAWEQYEKLVDGYFNMRKTIRENKIPSTIKAKEIEARLKNAKVRQANILLKIANSAEIDGTYKQVLYSYASEIVADKKLIPLPELEEETYSAGEIGKQLGISANKVGRLAKKHNLKTEQHGKWFHDKSRYSNKEVSSFRYYENVIPVIRKLIN